VEDLSAAQFRQLHQQLSQIYPGDYPLMNVEGEILSFMDIVQRSFTDGGPGGGHLIPGVWNEFTDSRPLGLDRSDRRLLMPVYTAASMAHARRDATIAKANEIYDRQGELVRMTPYQRHMSDLKTADEIIYSSWPRHRFFLIGTFMPATDRLSDLTYRAKAQHEATLTILALKRWRLQKNEYPLSLDELVAAGLLKELPMDPFGDGLLTYRRTDDDFILYSFGYNFTDDHGEYARNRNGRISKWSDAADTVFWPEPHHRP
jgi:hypothetical protein